MKHLILALLFIISFSAHAIDDTQLVFTIESDNVSSLKKLVQSKLITVNQTVKTPPYASAPILTIAARSASLKVLKYLIEGGADLNASTSVQETPLMLASFFKDTMEDPESGYARHEKAVRMLVEAGADVENIPEQYAPLAYASYSGHTTIMSYLISKGANPNGNNVQDGRTYNNSPLMMSVMGAGDKEGTLILLRANADAKIINGDKMTALMYAKKYNRDYLVDMLYCAEKLKPGEIFKEKCE